MAAPSLSGSRSTLSKSHLAYWSIPSFSPDGGGGLVAQEVTKQLAELQQWAVRVCLSAEHWKDVRCLQALWTKDSDHLLVSQAQGPASEAPWQQAEEVISTWELGWGCDEVSFPSVRT